MKRFPLMVAIILLWSCSGTKIHIPSPYETKPLFKHDYTLSVGPNSIGEAGDLAEEFPDENIVNRDVTITIDFAFNEKYDSSLYYKQYLTENRIADSIARTKRNKPSFSKNPELTEHPIPDGQVFMNTKYEYDFMNIKDFTEESVVLHYNSTTSLKNIHFSIDNNDATPEKHDESNDGYMYFKTDSRYKIYDLVLPLRGSRVNYEYVEECRDAKFNSVFYIPEDHFTQKKVIKIAMPEFLEFDIIEKNFEGLKYTRDTIEVSSKGGNYKNKVKYLVYTFKRIPAYKNNFADRGPSYDYPFLYFHFKTASDNGKKHNIMRNTDDLYNWYKLVSSNLTNDTTQIAPFTRNLVKGLKTDEEKIKAVFYWIQDNIRYIAFEDGTAGFRPDECADVFRKRYGDCKGMANLTKNMLKVLGFDARMVWIGTKHQNFSYDIPGMPVDNHAICAVKLNGKFVFLDGTENYCAYNDYANRIQGRRCIVENGDSYIIERIPEWGYEHNEEASTEVLSISGNKIEAQIRKTFMGESKLDLIRQYNYLRSENRERVMYLYLSDDNPSMKVTNLITTDMGNRDINPELKYNMSVSDQIFKSNNKLLVNIEWDREFDGFWLDSTRTVDLDLQHKMYIKRNVTFNLASGQKVLKLPKPVIIDNEYYSFRLEMKVVGNTIVYTKSIIGKKDYIPAKMLGQFRRDCGQLSKFYNTFIELSIVNS
jgi:hypothetical protein